MMTSRAGARASGTDAGAGRINQLASPRLGASPTPSKPSAAQSNGVRRFRSGSLVLGRLIGIGRVFRFDILEIGLDGSLKLDGHWLAEAIKALAGGDADPPFADAIFLHIGLFLPLEAD